MGKKSKASAASSNKTKVTKKKLDPSLFPDPLPALEDELGSLRLLDKPETPGSLRKNVGEDGYDDGGVGDLKLAIDLDDHVLRRKRGETNFVLGVQNDTLPRMREGQYKDVYRRDQKVQLAQILFSEDATSDGDMNQNPTKTSEVYQDNAHLLTMEDKKRHMDSLRSAKFALRLSIVLKEPACICLSLAEISKRYVTLFGKEGAENALRCANKGIEIATSEFYDIDEMALEAEDNPVPKDHEKEPTYPGLVNKALLEFMPIRVSTICLRSVYLHGGNALSAFERYEEAREMYLKALPILDKEPRSARLDWERSSFLVNIANTFSKQGDYAKADEWFTKAEALGAEQCGVNAMVDGIGLQIISMRFRSFALKRDGKEDEGKKVMREVISKSMELEKELVKHQEELKSVMNEQKEAEAKKAEAVAPSTAVAAQG